MSTFEHIDVAKLNEVLQAGEIQLVDVRNDDEVARGYIKGAVHLPLHLLPVKFNELDKAKKTVFYCHMGGRSAQACAFAVDQGMAGVCNLQGGILAWLEEGGELVA